MFFQSKTPEQIEKRRRFWRKARRRLGWTLAALFVAHSGLNIYASVLLNRELAAIRQKGQPLLLAEMAPPAVPDAQNAAPIYKQAADSLRFSTTEKGAFRTRPHNRTPQMNRDIEAAVRKNQTAVNLTRRAAATPQCRFPIDWDTDNPSEITFPHYTELRELAQLLAAQAVLNAKNGDSDAALRDVRALFGMSRHLAGEPVLIGFLVAQSIDSTAHQALAQVLETVPLTLAEAPAFQNSLPTHDWNRVFIHSLHGERTWTIFVFERIRQPTLTNFVSEVLGENTPLWAHFPLILVWHPFLKLDEVHSLRLWRQLLDAASTRPFGHSPNAADKVFETTPRYALLTRTLFPVFGRVSDYRDQVEVKRRQREVALALTSYRTARGSYPAQLQEVASLWGKTLPLDPFSNKPFVYRREGNSFLLYSVGANRTDDAGRNYQDKPPSRSWNSYDDIRWGNSPRETFRIYSP